MTAISAHSNSSLDLGFGDLCRYYYRALREENEDYTAHNVKDDKCCLCYSIGYYSSLQPLWLSVGKVTNMSSLTWRRCS